MQVGIVLVRLQYNMDSGAQKTQVYRMKHPKKSFHILIEPAFLAYHAQRSHRHAINRSIKNDIAFIMSFSSFSIAFITFLKGQFHGLFSGSQVYWSLFYCIWLCFL
jgi:hypothetical protein